MIDRGHRGRIDRSSDRVQRPRVEKRADRVVRQSQARHQTMGQRPLPLGPRTDPSGNLIHGLLGRGDHHPSACRGATTRQAPSDLRITTIRSNHTKVNTG